MKRYQGQTQDDQLRGGGSYVMDQKTGHEVCNFAPVRGRMYGYVQVGKERGGRYQEGEIDLARLGTRSGQDEIGGATIVWTATDPDPNEKYRKVVGWYENATIFRRFQSFEKQTTLQTANGIRGFWISAPANSCVLLAEDARKFEVPRMIPGFPGISPIWYADSPQSAEFVRSTLSFIAALGPGDPVSAVGATQAGQLAELGDELERTSYFSDSGTDDARARLLREVVQRRGQAQFRRELLIAYAGRCAVTGCDAVDALEAAHLMGYNGPNTQVVSNGLLLRADIHTLFDLGLLSICPDTLTVMLANALRQSSYADLHGRALTLPLDPIRRPSRAALEHRWRFALERAYGPEGTDKMVRTLLRRQA
jgi:hypothetical protein